MATYRGTDGAVFVGTDRVGEVRSFTLDISAEVINANVMGDTWAKNKGGIRSFSGSIEAYFDDADTGQTAIQAGIAAGTSVTLNLYPMGNSSGNIVFSGAAIITGINRSQSHDGMVEVSFNYTGDGALTQSTVV